MSDDEGFLRELLAHPNDTTTRLVYADFLDERDDPRGEFLRLELRLAELGSDDERVPWIQDRPRELRQEIDTGWRDWTGRRSSVVCFVSPIAARCAGRTWV
jgi:uncharacterized protein (TIGR02996 family)